MKKGNKGKNHCHRPAADRGAGGEYRVLNAQSHDHILYGCESESAFDGQEKR